MGKLTVKEAEELREWPEEEEEEPGNNPAKLLAKWAICVNSNGKLMVASSAKYIVHILKSTPANSLQKSVDLQQVNVSLEKMGATNTCLRLFTRTDKAYHTSYELLRQGKMPESKSLFGMMLNRLLSPADDEPVRAQQLLHQPGEPPDRALGEPGWEQVRHLPDRCRRRRNVETIFCLFDSNRRLTEPAFPNVTM